MAKTTLHKAAMRYAIYFRFDEKAENAVRDLRRSMMREIEGFPPRERKMPLT